MQAPPPQAGVNAATGMLIGPVKVELAGAAKFTWNFQRLSELVPKLSMKAGEPEGGRVVPSRSEGSRLGAPELKHCMVAAAPASIFARSNAQTVLPTNVFP